tara:strand:+ start:1381 stop:1605 length:225 start_codon:yes stop_codon:yes gene_type:complete
MKNTMIMRHKPSGNYLRSFIPKWDDPKNHTKDPLRAATITTKDVSIIFQPGRSLIDFKAVDRDTLVEVDMEGES